MGKRRHSFDAPRTREADDSSSGKKLPAFSSRTAGSWTVEELHPLRSRSRSLSETNEEDMKEYGRDEKKRKSEDDDQSSIYIPTPDHGSDWLVEARCGLNERLVVMSDRSVAVVLYKNEKLSIRGRCWVRSLSGSFHVLGHIIKPGQDKIQVFSPHTNGALVISPITDSIPSDEDSKVTSSDEMAIHRLRAKSYTSHTLVFSHHDDLALDFVTGLRTYSDIFLSKNQSSNCPELQSIGVDVLENDSSAVDIPDSYPRVMARILEKVNKGGQPRVCVCGGKDTGKSTMVRFLVNSLLNHSSQVVHLECDVGQSEFSPSGCVSLSTITSPLLGPPFTHRKKPDKLVYTGMISPAGDPSHYMACISDVWTAYQQMSEPGPLLINTMGWNKGLGVQLLVDTLRMTKPDFLVQMDCSQATKNFPPLSPDFVNQEEGFTDVKCDPVNHELIQVDSPVDPLKQSIYTARDHRELTLLSYLGQVATYPGQSVLSMTPYAVSWSKVALHACHSDVPNTQILRAINSNIVALCTVDESLILTSADDSCPKFLKQTPVTDCLGFGLVRAIDTEKKLLYLMTPVPQFILEEVNCLLAGALCTPHSLMQSQKVSNKTPYFDKARSVTGEKSLRRRSNMPRRQNTTPE